LGETPNIILYSELDERILHINIGFGILVRGLRGYSAK
jgi:hypothetical protein